MNGNEKADGIAAARENLLALDQLALALRNLRPHAFLMPFFAALIGVIYSRTSPLADVVLWFSVFIVSLVPLGIVLHLFFARPRNPA